MAALRAEIEDHPDTTQMENSVNRIETAIKSAHASVQALFVKQQTQATWGKRIAALSDADPPAP